MFYTDVCFFLVQEGYVWVLLDGGPTRAFSDLDIPMMEDDLNMLKVSLEMLNIFFFFFASSSVHQTLHLASLSLCCFCFHL